VSLGSGNSTWALVLEKAWSKVRGNYILAETGTGVAGVRSIIGAPVFMYPSYDADLWNKISYAD